LGATEVFRGATECGSGLTKGSDYPVATVVSGRGLLFMFLRSTMPV